MEPPARPSVPRGGIEPHERMHARSTALRRRQLDRPALISHAVTRRRRDRSSEDVRRGEPSERVPCAVQVQVRARHGHGKARCILLFIPSQAATAMDGTVLLLGLV